MGEVVRALFFWGEFFRKKCPKIKAPVSNHPGGKFHGGNCPGGNCPGRNYSELIVPGGCTGG